MRVLKVSAVAAAIMAMSMTSESSGVEAATLPARGVPNRHVAIGTAASVTGGIAHANGHVYLSKDGLWQKWSLSPFAQVGGDITTATITAGTETFTSGPMMLVSNVVNNAFFFCSQNKPAIYRYNIADDTTIRMAGTGVAGSIGASPAQVQCDAPDATAGGPVQGSAQTEDGKTLFFFTYDATTTNNNIVKMTETGAGLLTAVTVDAGVVASIAGGKAIAAFAVGAGVNDWQWGTPQGLIYYKDTAAGKDNLIFTTDAKVTIITDASGSPPTMAETAVVQAATPVQGPDDGTAAVTRAQVLEKMAGYPEAAGYFYSATAGDSRPFQLSWTDTLNEFRVDLGTGSRGILKVTAGALSDNGNALFVVNNDAAGSLVKNYVETPTMSIPLPTPAPTTRTMTLPLPTPAPPTRTRTTSLLPMSPAPKDAGPAGPTDGVTTTAAPSGGSTTTAAPVDANVDAGSRVFVGGASIVAAVLSVLSVAL